MVRLVSVCADIHTQFPFTSYFTVASIIKDREKKERHLGQRIVDRMHKYAHAERSQDRGNVLLLQRGHKLQILEQPEDVQL